MIIPLKIPAHEHFTDQELVEFCIANPELNVERDESGQLLINMTPTFALSSANNSELITEIGIWNRTAKAGKVLESNGGFFLADSSMRVPDVAWIRLDRWNKLSVSEKKSFPKLAPDFVVELKSETDNLGDLQAKMEKWMENGVRLGWLICTDEQRTYVYQSGQKIETVAFTDILSGEDILIDFSVKLSEILEY